MPAEIITLTQGNDNAGDGFKLIPIRDCEVRIAVEADLYPLVEIAREGTEESSYSVEFNETNTTEFFWLYIYQNEVDIAVAIIDNKVVGFVMMATSLEFHDKPFGYISKLWVAKEGRRSNAGRKLISSAIAWGKEKGCSHLFITATAELDKTEQKMFENLMKKSGFLDGGPVMSLKIES